nr:histidine phosphatase family protein [Saccharibacter sp. 17.LH.SD]
MFLRHGETDWNAQHLSQGRTDIPLNAKGVTQAEAAGELLASLFEQGKSPFTHIVASPLKRAWVTAEHVRDVVHKKTGLLLPLIADEALQEVSFGVQEGQPMGDWYLPWIDGKFVPQGGEAFLELRQRAVQAVNRAHDQGEGNPLIVAHGALFRALRQAMGLEVNVRLANAVPVHISHQDGVWEIEKMSHT